MNDDRDFQMAMRAKLGHWLAWFSIVWYDDRFDADFEAWDMASDRVMILAVDEL